MLFNCRGMAWKANLGTGGCYLAFFCGKEVSLFFGGHGKEKFAHGAWDIRAVKNYNRNRKF